MEIKLPGLQEQQNTVAVKKAIQDAAADLLLQIKRAPDYPAQSELDESNYSSGHLLTIQDGWEPPHKDIVAAYFRNFMAVFPEYGSDAKLASLLELSSDRRIREYKQGAAKVPYGVWRKFLVMTGRVAQDVIPVFGFFGINNKSA